MTRLLSHSVKTDKGAKTHRVGTAVMYLLPASLSGRNVCSMSTVECRAACLHDAGQLKFRASQAAQAWRTALYHEDRAEFIRRLDLEVAMHERACDRAGLRPAVRLNGTSDIRWERIAPDIFTAYPRVTFYDYTKMPLRSVLPKNYSLTFSLAETALSWTHHEVALDTMNVAVVFAGCGTSRYPKTFPKTWNGRRVIDGDLHDVRFLDQPRHGAYVGLRPKGRALKLEVGGFIRDAWSEVEHG